MTEAYDKEKMATPVNDREEIPSLEELVAMIDAETGQIPSPEHRADGETQELVEANAYGQKQYIRFFLDKTPFAIPLSSALEIGRLPDVTPLPNLPNWIAGISNIRGEIISIVDLKGFFGWTSHGPKRGEHFIIAHNQGLKAGIMVDRIMGILSLDQIETDIQDNPFAEGGLDSQLLSFVLGVVVSGEQVLYVLDIDKLLSSTCITDFGTE